MPGELCLLQNGDIKICLHLAQTAVLDRKRRADCLMFPAISSFSRCCCRHLSIVEVFLKKYNIPARQIPTFGGCWNSEVGLDMSGLGWHLWKTQADLGKWIMQACQAMGLVQEISWNQVICKSIGLVWSGVKVVHGTLSLGNCSLGPVLALGIVWLLLVSGKTSRKV